jgi:hypothetical protein
LVSCLLLALGATGAHAQATAPATNAPAETPAPAPAPAPLNLSLPQSGPAAAQPLLPSAPVLVAPLAPASLPAPALSAPSVSSAPAATLPVVQGDVPLPLTASAEVQRVTRWIKDSGDNGGMPYLVIDKANARVYSFSRAGQLQGDAPVLLGMAKGDRLLAPNSATMSVMRPDQRITPAGRFLSRLAIDSHGKELLVLDYDASISLHPVVKGKPEEHRAERLASPTSDDNRISFGCINAPIPFYANVVSPSFKGTRGIVYVLPETRAAAQLFGFQPFDAPAPSGGASTALAAPTVAPVAN